MLRRCELLPAAICTACLIFCCAACSPDIGQPLDLDQFSGEWFFAAGTPINASLSRCGRFLVRQASGSMFRIKYTALSHKNDIPITFNVDGSVRGSRIIGTWQLQGSKRKLGPLRHVIVFVNYNTVLAMVVCSEGTAPNHQGYKFSMIWSRERSVPLPILKELKSKLGAYINQGEIRMVDHGNC
ncbi:uncharacterized protein LOC143366762 [Andrena cerasifolii]|uniref:uncharacterized protein LOC143366762 n=1 Tax=Andrena cerasifolii TaxID=2819439 RepID=UPI0040376D33